MKDWLMANDNAAMVMLFLMLSLRNVGEAAQLLLG
jgi:hypothetical protein